MSEPDGAGFARPDASPDAFLRLIAENTGVGLYAWDLEVGRAVYLSPALSRLFGRPLDQLYNNTGQFVDLVHPQDRDAVRRALERRADGEPTDVEYRIAGDAGRWIRDRAMVHSREDGTRLALGMAEEVTRDRRSSSERIFLSDASALLSSHLEPERVIRELAHLAVPRMADWCRIHWVDGSGKLVAGEPVHRDPSRQELVREMERRFPPHSDIDSGVSRVIRTGESDLYPDIPDELLAAACQGPEHLRLVREIGLTSAMVVPLRSRSGVLGAISFACAESGRRYDDADLARAEEFAQRAALALENARLHQETRRARQEAESERGRTLEVLESIRDGFLVVNRDWRVVYANPVVRKWGPEDGELGASSLWDAFPELAGGMFEDAARRAMETREAVEVSSYHSVAGGWYHTRIYPCTEGLSILARDVSSRYREEEERRLFDRAAALLSSTHDYDVMLECLAELPVPEFADFCSLHLVEDGSLSWVASAQAEGADGEAWRELREAHVREGGDGLPTRRVLASGEPFLAADLTAGGVEEFLAECPETLRMAKRMGLCSVLAVPLRARGVTLGVLGLHQGPSRRHFGEADLAWAGELGRRAALAVDNARLLRHAEEARRAAEAANQAKSQFLAVMSHELRTPLNAVVGYADLLDTGVAGELGDRQRRYVSRIRESSGLLLSLIEEILNLSRIEAGRVELTLGELDGRQVVTDACTLLEPMVLEKGLELAVEVPDDPVLMRSDEGKLRQVLLNLLSNAVKFTETGRVTVDMERKGETVTFAVTDTGPGIPEEKRDEVFEPFARLAGSGERQRGTGLGLAVVRRYARLMGGDVELHPAPGGGSRFLLKIPLVPPDGGERDAVLHPS